jgi:hypothetical protein
MLKAGDMLRFSPPGREAPEHEAPEQLPDT